MSLPGELGLALRLARREMRGGTRGLGVFLACLALGVAAIAAVGTFAAGVGGGLAANAQAILGGDVQLVRSHVPVDSAVARALEARGDLSRQVDMRVMVRPRSGQGSALAELKAVDGAYPLYGKFELMGGFGLAEALAGRDGLPGAVAEQALLERLDLLLGDVVRVGGAEFVLTGIIRQEPDRVGQFWALGPRLIVGLEALAASGVVRPGTLAHYVYNLRLPGEEPDPARAEALGAEVLAAHPDGGFRVRTFHKAATRLTWLLDDVAQYLTLVGLATLLVGGIGVAGAVRAFLAGRQRSIAVMKALGASRRLVTGVYFVQVMALALAGSAAGALVGWIAAWAGAGPLALRLGVPLARTTAQFPALLAVAYGLLTALAFSLWPLSAAGLTSPARLFRGYADTGARRPGRGTLAACALVVLALTALLLATSEDRGVALGFAAGALGSVVVLWLWAGLVRRAAARLPRPASPRLRQALANLHRPGAATASVIFSLGLGLTVLVAVALAEGNIRDIIARQTPSTAPSFFFIDIPRGRMEALERTALDVPGVSRMEKQPSIRGRIVEIDGREADTVDVDPDVAWALRSDRGLTFAGPRPEGVELTQGAWWAPDYAGPPLICLDERVCRGFGMAVGDTLTVNVLGRRITGTVACTRRIDWTTGGLNHTIIFSPGVLDGAPYTWIATAYADREQETALFRAVTGAFPEVVAISMREVLENLGQMVDDVGLAVGAAAALALVAGLLVLAEAMRANLRARHYDAVVFKVLGATRRDIMTALVLEFAILGAAAAALAALLGLAGSWAFVAGALHRGWVFLPLPLLAITVGGVAATVLLGLLGVRRALRGSAWGVLRNE
jgi:putative ABC transport system permease protein